MRLDHFNKYLKLISKAESAYKQKNLARYSKV